VLAVEGRLDSALLVVGDLLPLAHLELEPAMAERFRHGSTIRLSALPSDGGRHAIFANGALLGIGRVDGALLQPEKVIAEGPL
jgi:hypothetical protein